MTDDDRRIALPAHADLPLCGEISQGLLGTKLEFVPAPAGGALTLLQRTQGDSRQCLRPTARRSDSLVGRNVTFHEYSAAVGTYEDPIYARAGGGYISALTFQHYEHDPSRGFVSGGHLAVAVVGIPLPINWHLPGAPTWGAEAKRIDREY
jgi:hypothetical protein